MLKSGHREKGEDSKSRDFLPKDKQYLVTRKVPCLRRATSLAYTDADEDAERLVSFGEGSAAEPSGEEWVETHAGRKATGKGDGEIADIPDIDGPGDADEITGGVGSLSLGKGKKEPEVIDLEDIPDMEEEGLEEGDEATAAPKTVVAETNTRYDCHHHAWITLILRFSTPDKANANLLSVRTYDVLITYDKYYQTPRLWLIGYDEVRLICPMNVLFQLMISSNRMAPL